MSHTARERFALAMQTYNKDNYAKKAKISFEVGDCFYNILISAESGFEPAINLLLTDIFTSSAFTQYDQEMLNEMIEISADMDGNVGGSVGGSGILYYLLGDLQQDCPGAMQNYYRKSMEKGFVLGKFQFARLMYNVQKNYSTALRHYVELLDHPQFKMISNYIQSQIYNDISLCYWREYDYVSFWKYNKKSRELKLGVAMNNAANAYLRGEGRCINIKKALKLYEAALVNGYDSKENVEWVNSQIEKCKNMILTFR